MAPVQPESHRVTCKDCGRIFTTFTEHVKCHAHAPCYQDGHYHRSSCTVCQSLFSTYLDGSSSTTDSAILAAFKLREWLRGLAKNFRPRDASDKLISSLTEREELSSMRAWVSPIVRHFPREVTFSNSNCLPARPLAPTPRRKGRQPNKGTKTKPLPLPSGTQTDSDTRTHPAKTLEDSSSKSEVPCSPSFIPEPEDPRGELESDIENLSEPDESLEARTVPGPNNHHNLANRLNRVESQITSIEKSLESKFASLAAMLRSQTEDTTQDTSPTNEDEVLSSTDSEGDLYHSPSNQIRKNISTDDSPVPWKRYDPESMEIGTDGSLVIDGSHVNADKVEINYDEPWPRWRFRTSSSLIMESTRPVKAILQPRKAFNDFGGYVMDNNPEVLQLQGATFPPFNRGFLVNTENLLFANPFFSIIASSFSEFCLKEKFEWDESSLPFNIIPGDASNSYFVDSYADNLGCKKLTPSAMRDQLKSTDFPRLSEARIREDSEARYNWFVAVSLTLGLEAMTTGPSQNPAAEAILSLAKLSLSPLQAATKELFRARLALRREGLRGCERDNPWVQQLLFSHPLSVALFASDVTECVQEQSRRLGWTIPRVLGFNSRPARPYKRRVHWRSENVSKRPKVENPRRGHQRGRSSNFTARGRRGSSRASTTQFQREPRQAMRFHENKRRSFKSHKPTDPPTPKSQV